MSDDEQKPKTEDSKGGPLPEDYREIDPKSGQQKAYIVLSQEERAKGFIRPVRRSYVHLACKTVTTMGQTIAETYARSPTFYGATFCCHCREHFRVNEFVWDGDGEPVGS